MFVEDILPLAILWTHITVATIVSTLDFHVRLLGITGC